MTDFKTYCLKLLAAKIANAKEDDLDPSLIKKGYKGYHKGYLQALEDVRDLIEFRFDPESGDQS